MTCTQPNCRCCPRCGTIKRPCSCCYCAPAALCLRIVDDDGVVLMGVRLPWDEDAEVYSGILTCGDDDALVEVTLGQSDYGECVWRVFSYLLGIDEEFHAGAYGNPSTDECLSPVIDIPGVCGGTAQIRAELWVAPDYYRGEYGDECADYFCGTCRCICGELCFTFSDDDGTCTGLLTWDRNQGDTVRWEGNLDCGGDQTKTAAVVLYRDPETGGCLADIEIEGRYTETVDVSACGDEFGFEIEDLEHTVSVRCAECGSCPKSKQCPCCPITYDTLADGSISATSVVTRGANGCGIAADSTERVTEFTCGFVQTDHSDLYVKLECDEDNVWHGFYFDRGAGCAQPPQGSWVEATLTDEVCPSCDGDGNLTPGYFRWEGELCVQVSGGTQCPIPIIVEVFVEGPCVLP